MSYSFLQTEVIIVQVQNAFFAMRSRASGAVFKGKAAAESGPI